MREAIANHVLPIDDRLFERANPEVAGRPDSDGRPEVADGLRRHVCIPENAFINVKNSSFSITADVIVPDQPASGVLVAQGGRFGGWSLYVKDGKPTYYNFLGLKRFTIASEKPLAPGKVTIVFDFVYDGGGPGKGGTGILSVNGEKVGQGRIEVTRVLRVLGDRGRRCRAEHRHTGLLGLYLPVQVQWEDRESDDRPQRRQSQGG